MFSTSWNLAKLVEIERNANTLKNFQKIIKKLSRLCKFTHFVKGIAKLKKNRNVLKVLHYLEMFALFMNSCTSEYFLQ